MNKKEFVEIVQESFKQCDCSQWAEENEILIVIEGGVVQNVLNIPKGIKVKIIDYLDYDLGEPEDDGDDYVEDVPQGDGTFAKARVLRYP